MEAIPVTGETVHDRFAHWAGLHPDKLLFAFLNRHGDRIAEYTYGGFVGRVRAIAESLQAVPGLAPGSRLLLAYQPGLEMIAALFAASRAGFIAVPCAPISAHGLAQSMERMAHVATDCGAAIALTDSETIALLEEDRQRQAGDAATAIEGIDWLDTGEMHGTGKPLLEQANPILFLQYTSGSTSQPKGVMVTHENVLHNCGLIVSDDFKVSVSWLPQHHDMGLIGYYLYVALTGGTNYGFSPATFMQRPALWLETISKYRATTCSAPNFAYELCLHEKRVPESLIEELDLSSLTVMMAAAEPINPDIVRRFRQRFAPCGLDADALAVSYGLAEFTLAVSSYGRNFQTLNKRHLAAGSVRTVSAASEVADQVRLMSCGKPLGDTETLIVDPESREQLPTGATGEVWLGGRSKCAGYWNQPELTSEVFRARALGLPGEYLRTGDMGFLLDGELFICGRLKDMIIIRGQNHYPQDIERVVEDAFPALRRGCVAAFEVEALEGPGVALVAEVTPRIDPPSPAEIAALIAKQFKLKPERIALVAPRSVVKTSSGKIRRFKTRELLESGELRILSELEAAAETGQAWGDETSELAYLKNRYNLAGDEEITLFDAGIDSLDLTTFVHWLKEMVGQHDFGGLAERIDMKILGAITVRQIFETAELLEKGEMSALGRLHQLLVEQYARHLAREREMMLADRRLPFDPGKVEPADPAEPPRHVLLTGGTGFLGPFLLESLLRLTSARVTVMVRARDSAHAQERLAASLSAAGLPASLLGDHQGRIGFACGDLEKPSCGLGEAAWQELAASVDTIYHNGALVNYILDYRRMRAANVTGTQEILRLAFDGRPKVFNHISSTFIFGWSRTERLDEENNNDGLELLDFGYSQSKWVSEQLVHDAAKKGLVTRVFRPALITPSVNGGGENLDITMRLLAFLIKYGLGATAQNQVSLMPADVTANNIVAISGLPDTAGRNYHVVRDAYENLTDVTTLITARTGRRFERMAIAELVPEMIRRCTRQDPLYPLLDFLIGSADNIAGMEFKLYDSSGYREARDRSGDGMPDPGLPVIVDGILAFLGKANLMD